MGQCNMKHFSGIIKFSEGEIEYPTHAIGIKI